MTGCDPLTLETLLRDAKFQQALKQFKLPEGAILAIDPVSKPFDGVIDKQWIYGSDTRDPIERLVTFMVYIRVRPIPHRSLCPLIVPEPQE